MADQVDDWEDCTRCQLSQFRRAAAVPTLFGHGERGGIMCIGSAPSLQDIKEQEVFSSEACEGTLKLYFDRAGYKKVYYTNLVGCRSTRPRLNAQGEQVIYRGHPVFDDVQPPQICIEACFPRLWSEIYYVDPILILTVGTTATKTLLPKYKGGPARDLQYTALNGLTVVPRISRGKWERKVKGVIETPSDPYLVKYPVLSIGDIDRAWDTRTDMHERALYPTLLNQLQHALLLVHTYDNIKEEEPTELSEVQDDNNED